MKITSWNCNLRLRGKYEKLIKFDERQAVSDIYVIMECENPETTNDIKYKQLLSNGFWKGANDNKGLAVFSPNPNIKLELLDWPGNECKYFLPIRVNDSFTLVGVWSCNPYCKMFYEYLDSVYDYIEDDVLFIGDFNSNVRFDKASGKSAKTWRNCVTRINAKGLVDVYNYLNKEEEGQETTPTFFMYRHLNNPYHIDHCLANPNIISTMKVLVNPYWLTESDHLPLVVEVKEV